MMYQLKRRWGKIDCMDLWVIKPTNQVSPSSRFWVPHCSTLLHYAHEKDAMSRNLIKSIM